MRWVMRQAMRWMGLFVLCAALGSPAAWAAGPYYVERDPAGAGDAIRCRTESWDGPLTGHATLHGLLDEAESGTVIRVKEGTYTVTGGNVFRLNAGVRLYGGFAGTDTHSGTGTEDASRDIAAHATVLSGGGRWRVVLCAGSAASEDTHIDGFTITNGHADKGGGMGCFDGANLTVANCLFTGNEAILYQGGGLYCENASPTVVDCVFRDNAATGYYGGGGGMACYAYGGGSASPNVIRCVFAGNTADGYYDGGGGLGNYAEEGEASPTVIDCAFESNAASYGGGMFNYAQEGAASPVVRGCSFTENEAGYGGGIFNCAEDLGFSDCAASPEVSSCDFAGNMAIGGGGMYNYAYGVSFDCAASPTVTAGVFRQNQADEEGGGIANYAAGRGTAEPAVADCVFKGNAPHR